MSFNTSQTRAAEAHILATTPLFYRPDRLVYFAQMVRTLARFPTQSLHFVVLTQTEDIDDIASLEKIVEPYRSARFQVDFRTERTFSDQFDLCWRPRLLINDLFLCEDSRFTHFVYFEDDIEFSYQNFCYFIQFSLLLKPHGLIPSFIRVEFNYADRSFVYTDQSNASLDLDKLPTLNCNGTRFVGLPEPYCAIYVLDREMALEYISSQSFDRTSSAAVTGWGVPERAALGLAYENVPKGYTSRYVLPLNDNCIMPSAASWVYHLPNNFTNANPRVWGKHEVGQLIRPTPASKATDEH